MIPTRLPLAVPGPLLAAALLAFGCAGGSPTADSNYPAVKGIYGSYNGLTVGFVRQTWTGADGAVTVVTCNAVLSIPDQSGAQFSGTIDRLGPCYSQATLAGQVAQDSSIRFSVTQARWGSCTATGTNEYTGIVHLGSLLATGRVALQCDDGGRVSVEEQISGSLTVPVTTPG